MTKREIAAMLLGRASRVLCSEDTQFLRHVADGRQLPYIPDPSGKAYGEFAAVKMSLLTQNFAAYLNESPTH
jgi:hypothetical protein